MLDALNALEGYVDLLGNTNFLSKLILQSAAPYCIMIVLSVYYSFWCT